MHRLNVFRAIDDRDSCERFAAGHLKVLSDYGVSKVTTAKLDWFNNPDVYVVLVESEDGSVTYGGERIHISNDFAQLPIEEAVSVVDMGIYPLIAKYKAKGITGELCGLWNSKEIAGKGYSVVLTKVGVALAKILKMDSLFVLCAPYTVAMCEKAGFVIETSIGNSGTFYYPKLDLIATALVIDDLINLPGSDAGFKEKIINMRENKEQKATESGPLGNFEIQYDLTLKQHQIHG